MMPNPSPLSPIALRFERELKSGANPSLTDFVKQVSARERSEVVEELLELEIEHRTHNGIRIRLTEFEGLGRDAQKIASKLIKKSLGLIVHQFENRWKESRFLSPEQRPDIRKYLSRVDRQFRSRLLSHLIRIEVKYRSDSGESISATDYSMFGDPAVRAIDSYLQQSGIDLNNSDSIENESIPNSSAFESEQVSSAPRKSGPVEGAPIQPVKREPVESAPLQSAPIQGAPAQRAPVPAGINSGSPRKDIPADNVTNKEQSDLSTLAGDLPPPNKDQYFSAGQKVGPYQLVRPLGKGGMGLVWLADQLEPVRRKVALKLMRPGLSSREWIGRFEAERQALAIMDHPNIIKVLGGGETEGGFPYYVMEYVKGIPITDYCDRNQLTLRQRLKLFVKVCRAINHAHSKSVVHRDLKPGNILVTTYDGQPEPKLLDFGLAKATKAQARLTDEDFATRVGQVIGTPLYMSPEQADIGTTDIDERADIYALGVIIFELAVGSTPILQRDLDNLPMLEILTHIRETPLPSMAERLKESESIDEIIDNRSTDLNTLIRNLNLGLDKLVQRACAFDTGSRYQSAWEMLQELDVIEIPRETITEAELRARKAGKKTSKPIGTKFTPRLMVLAGAILLLVLLLLLVAIYLVILSFKG